VTSRTRTTDVRPFRALHFDPRRVAIADVVSPPFDVVEPGERERLLERSPYNAVRLILPDEGTEEAVHATICAWREAGVLTLDPAPCFYWVQQDYVGPDGQAQTRGGFIGLVRLEPHAAGIVRRHELTRAAPVAGRLRLLRAARAHLSPIFVLYRDPDGVVEAELEAGRAAERPELDIVSDAGTRYRLWRVTERLDAVSALLAASPLLIADGHHRYETALAYMEERGASDDDPASFMPMYLVNADASGLTVLPTHRVVRGIAERQLDELPAVLRAQGLDVEEAAADAAALEARLAQLEGAAAAIYRGRDRSGLLVSEPGGRLGADFAQERILGPALGLDPDEVARTDRIEYVRRTKEAAAQVDAAGGRLALLLRAPSVDEVEAVVARGDVMPQKSTYFYPKLLDGLVFYALDGCT